MCAVGGVASSVPILPLDFILVNPATNGAPAIINSHRGLIRRKSTPGSAVAHVFGFSVHAAAGARNNLGAPYVAFVNRYRVLHGKEAMQEKSHTDCAAILQIADFIASEENNT